MKKNEKKINMYEEDPEEKRLLILKRLGITILVILGILIIFMLLKSCVNKRVVENDLNKVLLEAGKEYYEYNDYALPDSIGECATVDLQTLSELGLIDKTKYSDCENDTTYVKVCKLESGKYHFVAFMNCTSEQTEKLYGNFEKGKEKDIKDSSDIKFKYQVEYLNTEIADVSEKTEEYWEDEIPYKTYKTEAITKYYRFRDLEYIWNVESKRYYPGDTVEATGKEYYISSPATDYIYKDSESTSVSKYFKVVGAVDREYWLDANGEKKYSYKAPDDEYIYPASPIHQTKYKVREWNAVSNPVTAKPTQIWYCASPDDENQVTSFVPCSENVNNPKYTIEIRMIYSCNGGITEVGQNGVCYRCTDDLELNESILSCGYYGELSKDYTTTPCDTTNPYICEATTRSVYQWYKLVGGTKEYYPSGKSSAAEENTYYSLAPAQGLTADPTTTRTGWKWYKKVNTQSSSYSATSPQSGATKTNTSRWTSWSSWTTSVPKSLGTSGTRTIESKTKIKLRTIKETGSSTESWVVFNKEFMNLDELLLKLQEANYKVYSLEDITTSGELKYKVELYIRNKEVK